MSGSTVAELVDEGTRCLSEAGIGPARMEAEILLARRMGVARAALILDPGSGVAQDAAAAFRADVAKRATRYPLQYLTGVQEFYSLDFEVDERVLIPRPETELIVDAMVLLDVEEEGPVPKRPRSAPRIVDVGTGSGCIAVTLAVRHPAARVFACDISEGALEVAARNAARHGVSDRIRFAHGDGLAPAMDAGLAGQVDVIVSNPPYIDEAALAGLQPELAHEPRGALTPGPDGLAFTARLVADAARVLGPGGRLLIEMGAGSEERVRRLFDPAIWERVGVVPDHQRIPRLLVAHRRDDEDVASS